MTFFAFHRSGVMFAILPCLYADTSSFACASPVEPVNNVLFAPTAVLALTLLSPIPQHPSASATPSHRSWHSPSYARAHAPEMSPARFSHPLSSIAKNRPLKHLSRAIPYDKGPRGP